MINYFVRQWIAKLGNIALKKMITIGFINHTPEKTP